MRASRMPVDQVKQWKKIDPDDVDEVPVEASDFDGSVVLRSEASLPCREEEPEKNAEADNHVQRVQTRHDKVEREKNLSVGRIRVLARMAGNFFLIKTKRSAGNVMLHKLVFVLDSLNAEEGETEEHGYGKAANEQGSAGGLSSPDCEHHGQAAADEHRSVRGAKGHVDGLAGSSEVSEIPSPIN